MNRKFKQFHQYQLNEQSPLNNDGQQFHQLQHNEQLNKKRSQHMMLEIQVLVWDRHKNVAGLKKNT